MNINERIDYCAFCDANRCGFLVKKPMTDVIENHVVSYIGEELVCSSCGKCGQNKNRAIF